MFEAPHLRHYRRRAAPPPGTPGRLVRLFRALRVRRGSGRPYHGSRPGESGVVLGKPFRCPFGQIRVSDCPGESRGRSGGRQTTRSIPLHLRSIRGARCSPRTRAAAQRTRCMARHGRRWALLDPITQDAVRVLRGSRLFDDYTGVVYERRKATGSPRRWVIPKLHPRNHGLLTWAKLLTRRLVSSRWTGAATPTYWRRPGKTRFRSLTKHPHSGQPKVAIHTGAGSIPTL